MVNYILFHEINNDFAVDQLIYRFMIFKLHSWVYKYTYDHFLINIDH